MIDYPNSLTYQFPLSKIGYAGYVTVQFTICNGAEMNIPIDKNAIIKCAEKAFESIKRNFS